MLRHKSIVHNSEYNILFIDRTTVLPWVVIPRHTKQGVLSKRPFARKSGIRCPKFPNLPFYILTRTKLP